MKIQNLNIGPFTKRFNPLPDNKKFILHHDQYDLYQSFNSIENLTGKSILDFGGSFGNLIQSSHGKINPLHYTSLDVDQESLKMGRDKFPLSNWIHQDLYNPMYNPDGSEVLHLDRSYDIIIAYSVFTHDTFKSFRDSVSIFKKHLTSNGKILVTILLNDSENVKHIVDKRKDLYGNCDQIDSTKDINYLVNNKNYFSITDKFSCDFLYTFYKKSFIEKYGILHTSNLPQSILEVDINAF